MSIEEMNQWIEQLRAEREALAAEGKAKAKARREKEVASVEPKAPRAAKAKGPTKADTLKSVLAMMEDD